MHHVGSLFNGNESSDDLLRCEYARPPPICVQYRYGVVGHIGGNAGRDCCNNDDVRPPMTPPNSNINWPVICKWPGKWSTARLCWWQCTFHCCTCRAVPCKPHCKPPRRRRATLECTCPRSTRSRKPAAAAGCSSQSLNIPCSQ
jgi:hypothetical protein